MELATIDANHVDQYMQNASDAPRVTLLGAAVLHVADLWRRLPPGDQARCHIPPYGLRFFSDDHLVCEASICWACNNIFGVADGRKIHYAFDAEHSVSQELLAEINRIAIEAKFAHQQNGP